MSVWLSAPVVQRKTTRLCGSTAMLRDTVCHATPTARCREWASHAHAHAHATNENDLWPRTSLFSCTAMDERGCPVDTRTGWATFSYDLSLAEQDSGSVEPFSPLSSLGTTIAAAVGGVVLFFILLGLLFFYLRRQKKLKRKETMRRILQEHEVGAGQVLVQVEAENNL